jgi:hypothetical protein
LLRRRPVKELRGNREEEGEVQLVLTLKSAVFEKNGDMEEGGRRDARVTSGRYGLTQRLTRAKDIAVEDETRKQLRKGL